MTLVCLIAAGCILFWIVVFTVLDALEIEKIPAKRRILYRRTKNKQPDTQPLFAAWPQPSTWGPVQGEYAGTLYAAIYPRDWEWGVIGIQADSLVFVGVNDKETRIPIQTIRAIRGEGNDLTVYQEGWQIYRFRAMGLAAFLHTTYQIPLGNCPDEAQHKVFLKKQTIYGLWEEAGHATLALIPDRLLFDWRDLVYLAHIRQITAIRSEAKTQDHTIENGVLRLEYELPDNLRQVIGLEMPFPRVREWARSLSKLTGIPSQEELGRKKKEL
jgi:hypothetical protein